MYVKAMVAEIVRITCGNDSVECEPSGIAVIRVKSIALPRVVGEDNVRLGGPNPIRDLIADMERWLQLAIDMAKHYQRGKIPVNIVNAFQGKALVQGFQ